MMSNLPRRITEVRHDLSDWLWHFTRRDNQPFETLKQIVSMRHIRGSQDRFCEHTAVCLTEMPITEAIRQSAILDESSYNRFSDYGIGFRKRWIASKGGLPVVYQPNDLRSELGHNSQWRHCEMDFEKGIDFSWQREWRVPVATLTFAASDDLLLVVRTAEEAFQIVNENWEVDFERDEFWFDHVWPYITHDRLAAAKRPADIEVLKFSVFDS